ncbi:hypothetical protein NE235_26700 [Actinoallomurus spadix]|uniref:hypothetical protein n=1 Tax=Actinoallomurus spadix TaxID=79912 RepID=UPI002093E603|nr:hypothetical protein [Actinoallomurus spadix]MCO5989704.1 hypothetical protein [Actinoallomurus spadix]
MGELRCEVTDFDGPARWRWVLTGPGGRFLGDHEVRLDEADWRYEAFTDLRAYLLWHTAPDRRLEQETRIVAEVGTWLGEQVFGPLGAVMVREPPATVRIVLPVEARTLAFRPFELAHVDGRPLALRNVTLVTQVGAQPRRSEKGVRERLRAAPSVAGPVGQPPRRPGRRGQHGPSPSSRSPGRGSGSTPPPSASARSCCWRSGPTSASNGTPTRGGRSSCTPSGSGTPPSAGC